MPTAYTLTADFDDLLGGDDISLGEVRLESNVPGGAAIIDTAGNKIRLGSKAVPLGAGHTVSIPGIVGSDSTDLNIGAGTLQYQLTVTHHERHTSGHRATTWKSGWFYLNASANLADLATEVTPVVAETGADLIAQMQAIADAQATTTDAQVEALVENPASATAVALSSTFGRYDMTGRTLSQVNAFLAASSPLGVKKLVGTLAITATLVVQSGTYLDLTDASITATGTTHRMLQNASYGSSSTRDSRITVVGGTFTAGATDGDTHRIVMHRVDDLRIHGTKITSTSGKYAILLADVTDFKVRDITLDVASDGIHWTGPAKDGLISNIVGKTGDDFVAGGCSDYLAYDLSRGNVDGVTVEKLRPALTSGGDGGNGCKLFTVGDTSITDTMVMSNVTIRDVKGTTKENGVLVTDDFANNGSMHSIRVEDVSVVIPTGGWSQVKVAASTPVTALSLAGVNIPKGAVADTMGVLITKSIDRVNIDGLTSASANRQTGVKVTGGTVATLNLTGVDFPLPTTDSRLLHVTGSAAVVTTFNHANGKTSGSAAGDVITVNSSGTLSRVNVANFEAGQASGGNFLAHSGSGTIDLSYSNVSMVGPFASLQGTGGVIIRGHGYRQLSSTAFFRNSTQTLRTIALDFPVSLDKVARNQGDMVFNNNGGLTAVTGTSGGLYGLCVCDGVTWKQLISGSTY